MSSPIANENTSPVHSGSNTIVKLPSIKDFTIIKPISRGAFGKVFLCCKNDKPNRMFAVKVMKKKVMVHKNMMKQVLTERDALALSRSHFVVNLFYSMQSVNNIYLVMEYMIGGDVKSLLSIYGFFDEEMAIFYTAEAAHALEYLHQHNIVHRDLKPDNMLISSTGHIKLTDFGLSKITIDRPIKLIDLLGSPSYNKGKDECLPNRTPGQLLSLTSAIGFTYSKNKISESCTASPNFEGNVCYQPSSASDSAKVLRNRSLDDNKGSISTYTSPLALRFETPDKFQKPCGETMNLDSDNWRQNHDRSYYDLNSSQSSCSSYTPFHSRDKRKILRARSTRNLREIKQQGSFTSPDFVNSKLKKLNRKVRSEESLNFQATDRKRKRSSPEEDYDFRPMKRSTGLSCVLSELDFNSKPVVLDELKAPNFSNLSSESNPNLSRDDVFESSDDEKASPVGRRMETAGGHFTPQTSVTSAVGEALPRKSVNFCFNSWSSRASDTDCSVFQSSVNTSFGSLRDASKSISMFSTPAQRRISAANVRTPLQSAHTPYRTPKSVRRGPEPTSNERILGTPDYLAPELLLHMEHNFPVDWWALGVCLFEFLTGIPPFNDISPEAVFSNILNRDIPWPEEDEALSETAKNAIDLLLTSDPNLRPGVKEFKGWSLFENIDWENILHMQAPFIPVPDSDTDTTYFDARNEAQHIRVSSFEL